MKILTAIQIITSAAAKFAIEREKRGQHSGPVIIEATLRVSEMLRQMPDHMTDNYLTEALRLINDNENEKNVNKVPNQSPAPVPGSGVAGAVCSVAPSDVAVGNETPNALPSSRVKRRGAKPVAAPGTKPSKKSKTNTPAAKPTKPRLKL